jgi:hypothetical protein
LDRIFQRLSFLLSILLKRTKKRLAAPGGGATSRSFMLSLCVTVISERKRRLSFALLSLAPTFRQALQFLRRDQRDRNAVLHLILHGKHAGFWSEIGANHQEACNTLFSRSDIAVERIDKETKSLRNQPPN